MSRPTRINWDGFTKLINEETNTIESAMCKTCRQILKSISGRRFDIHRKSCRNKENVNEDMELDAENCDDDKGHNEDDVAEKTKILNIILAKFFFSASIPFKQVENKYFSEFINALCDFKIKYKPPCRDTLSNKILQQVYDEIVEKKTTVLEDTDSILLVDGWHNKSANKKYLVFSLRNINTMNTYLTFFDTSIESEDGENLALNINKAIRLAKDMYETNVCGIVSDNDSKIIRGGRLAETFDNKKLLQSTCSSHSGNLLVKQIAAEYYKEDIRDILNKFREPKLESLLLSEGGTKLKNFPDTRFCYFCDSCRSLLSNLPFLRKICALDNVTLDEWITQTFLSEEFELRLREIVSSLDPICVLINKCQDPHCNVADAVELWLSLKLPTNKFDDFISLRIKKAIKPVGYAANIMHHKYRGKILNEEQTATGMDFLHEYLNPEAKSDLEKYINSSKDYEKYSDGCHDSVAYWSLVGWTLPTLSKFMINLMLIPASTAAIEGLFSNWTYVHTSIRNRLGNLKSSCLLDIYYSLKFMNLYDKFNTTESNR